MNLHIVFTRALEYVAMVNAKVKKTLSQIDPKEPVEAVFVLKNAKFAKDISVDSGVRSLIHDAELATEQRLETLSVMPRILAFAVKAPASLVSEIAKNKFVHSMTLNEADQELLIR